MDGLDPYRVLGVPRDVSSEQLHDAYREAVKRHHPDRNGGSPEATRRFQEVQWAYETLRDRAAPAYTQSVEERMQALERELREARAAAAKRAKSRVRREPPAPPPAAPQPEADSFGAILADVRDEIAHQVKGPDRHPSVQRVVDLIDGLEDLAGRLDKR